MRNAYAILGVAFLVLLGGSYYLLQDERTPQESNKIVTMKLASPAFEQDGFIPDKYTCEGENVNPPLEIRDVPEGAHSLVLIMDDPDVPKELRPDGVFDHWVLYAIDPNTKEIQEGIAIGVAGLNGRGEGSYTGPCPPTEYEPTTHRYIFKLYALSGTLNFIKAPTKSEVLEAISPMVIGEAELVGRYTRVRN